MQQKTILAIFPCLEIRLTCKECARRRVCAHCPPTKSTTNCNTNSFTAAASPTHTYIWSSSQSRSSNRTHSLPDEVFSIHRLDKLLRTLQLLALGVSTAATLLSHQCRPQIHQSVGRQLVSCFSHPLSTAKSNYPIHIFPLANRQRKEHREPPRVQASN